MSGFNPRLFACILLSTICAGGCTRDTNGGVTLPEGHIVERERFTAEVFFEAPGMNLVYDLRYGDFDGEAGSEVLVVSQDGYRLVSPEGRLKRTVAFQPAEAERWAVKYVGSAAGGDLAFVAALPLKRQLGLYGADGNSVWTAPAPGDYPLLNIADVSGDGVVEIISALRGIQVHDRGGNRVRTLTKRTCASVAIVALPNPDGPRIIADLRGDGANPEGIHVFSAEGRVLSQWTPDFFYRDFAAVERSGERLPELVFANGDSLVVKGLDGKTLRTLDAPLARHFAVSSVQRVDDAGGEEGLAVLLTTRGSSHMFMLCVYDAGGTLQYQYRGADDAASLLHVGQGLRDGDGPSLLVGGRNEVWRFVPQR